MIGDKKIAVRLFETKVHALAEKIHRQELENLKQKMGEYMELSKNLLNQIETHKQNKPFNPFKIKAWTKELDDLVHKHENCMKAQYDNLKTDYQRIKKLLYYRMKSKSAHELKKATIMDEKTSNKKWLKTWN